LGVTYKANISDLRETPARPLIARLLTLGADVRFYDPFVDTLMVNGQELVAETDLALSAAAADLVILLQAHDEIVESSDLDNAALILDTRGVLVGSNVERL